MPFHPNYGCSLFRLSINIFKCQNNKKMSKILLTYQVEIYIKVVGFESYRIPCGLFYYQFLGIKGWAWKLYFPSIALQWKAN
jgi:hypothetical protein